MAINVDFFRRVLKALAMTDRELIELTDTELAQKLRDYNDPDIFRTVMQVVC